MSKTPSPPTPPDPAAQIAAQSAANRQAAEYDANANRVNINAPNGSIQWNPIGGDRWEQNVTYSPGQQQLFNLQEQQGIALGQMGLDQTQRVADIIGQNYTPRRWAGSGDPLNIDSEMGGGFSNARFDPTRTGPVDYSRFDPTGGQLELDPYYAKNLGDYGSDVEKRTYDLATQGLEHEFGRSEESLRTRLANQGVTPGSEAFDAEMRAFEAGRGDAYANARLNARNVARADRGQAVDELNQMAGLTSAENADQLGRLSAGFGVSQGQNADNMGRLAMGADLNSQDWNTRLASILQERGLNRSNALEDYQIGGAEDLAARQVPLQEIISIMSGTPLNVMQPSDVPVSRLNAVDAAGINQQGYQNQYNVWQQQQANRNAMIGALAQLGGSAFGAFGLPGVSRTPAPRG